MGRRLALRRPSLRNPHRQPNRSLPELIIRDDIRSTLFVLVIEHILSTSLDRKEDVCLPEPGSHAFTPLTRSRTHKKRPVSRMVCLLSYLQSFLLSG